MASPYPLGSVRFTLATLGLLTGISLACGGGSRSTPSPTPTPVPAPPPELVILGHVVEYASGRPIAGAVVNTDLQLTPFTADANGEFRIGGHTIPRTFHVTIEAPGYITRETYVRLHDGTRSVTIDLLRNAAPFSIDFYRQLVRNSNESEEFDFVRHLTENPSIYIRTVDQNGRDYDPELISGVNTEIRKAVSSWSAGTLSVTTVETGVETRPRAAGWIVVNILRDRKTEICGNAYVGAADGQIQLWSDCSCRRNKLPGALVAHEVGHAMGFWHVKDERAIMHKGLPPGCVSGALTDREKYHAKVAYSRPRENTDQDVDPDTMAPFSTGDAPFVEN